MRLHGDFQWRSKIPGRCHPAWRRSSQHVNPKLNMLSFVSLFGCYFPAKPSAISRRFLAMATSELPGNWFIFGRAAFGSAKEQVRLCRPPPPTLSLSCDHSLPQSFIFMYLYS
jgi:hypothetical protein